MSAFKLPFTRPLTPKRRTLTLLLAATLAAPLLAPPPAQAQVLNLKYVVTDLGTLGGSSANANGINDAGQVVGTSKLAGDAANRAFRTAPNKPINPVTDNLGTLGGANSTGAAINRSGQVVGTADSSLLHPNGSSGVRRAFRADPGAAMVDLGTLANPLVGGANGFNNSGANGINDDGNVVGFATVPADLCGSVSHAFRTGPNTPIGGAFSNLGTLVPFPNAGCRSSTAYGINSANLTVGDSATNPITGFPNYAFRYSLLLGMQGLSTMGGRDAVAYAVNDAGEIVGRGDVTFAAFPAFPVQHAFLASGFLVHSIGTLGGSYSAAFAINHRPGQDSQVVGDSSTTGDAAIHAFVYSGNIFANGLMVDLNTRIAANSGWELVSARGINSSGQIVGTAWKDGVRFVGRAVRLDPVDLAVKILSNSLADYPLSGGQFNSLTDKLASAYVSIQQGFNKRAVNQLTAALSSIDAWQRTGNLDASTAAALSATLRAVIAAL